MDLLDADHLARTATNVNDAHLFGRQISKTEARKAERFLVSRYFQNIPKSIAAAKNPDPRWASLPKSFNLTDAEKLTKPKTITGEAVANASMRMIHSRESARALYILSDVTGSTTPEADELCNGVRVTGDEIANVGRQPFF